MTAGYADDDDGFDEILRGVRGRPGPIEPRRVDLKDNGG
jgi:hypothetical protein